MTWHDDDRFWERFGPAMFGAARYAAAAAEVDDLLALLDLPDAGRILDLPCGPGVHSLALAARGHRVTGVDRTAAFVETGRRLAAERGLAVEWHGADMRTYSTVEPYDAVLSLFSSFGYFDDRADDRAVLQRFHEALRPGGHLVMDLMGREVLARIFRPRDWRTLDDGTIMLEERAIRDEWTWIDNRWILLDGAERHEARLGMRLYAGVELRALVESVGFSDVRILGSLRGTPYDHDAERLVVHARRPPTGSR